MSRKTTSAHDGPRKKRRAGTFIEFAAPSEADLPFAQNNIPSPAAASTRTLPVTSVPALSTLCARVFVANLAKLSQRESTWKPTRECLKILPDSLVPKIFAMLRASCPTILSEPFIVAVRILQSYFLRKAHCLLVLSSRTFSNVDE
jgi:hypothetical protein